MTTLLYPSRRLPATHAKRILQLDQRSKTEFAMAWLRQLLADVLDL
eukprot:COSAG01_NODE_3155_length_6492_cov_3.966995_11_plen_46_part_00